MVASLGQKVTAATFKVVYNIATGTGYHDVE